MSPDSLADGRESEAFFLQALINTTPIAREEEAAHIYATPPLSPNIRSEQDVPRIVDNIQAASYCGERPDNSHFTLFPKLPSEIRLYIWQYALSVPRIIEVKFSKTWSYRSKTLPPLLSCNRESRTECLKAYSTYSATISRWIRFDWDILYLKKLDFSTSYSFVRPEFRFVSVQQWEPQEEMEITDESDKWLGRPENFEKLYALAVNREVLTQTDDDYECIIRHFFPRLELLIVLIDDGIPIREAWDVKEDDFKAYESDWAARQPRVEFTSSSTGPFTPVSDVNLDYEKYVKNRMVLHFQTEQRNYEEYKAPFISVRGCRLPPDVEVPECGRWPDGWEGWVRSI
jgi:hypothetical protein